MEVAAQELVEAYRVNTVAADEKYKDKRLRVKGVLVERVGRTVNGNPVIASREYDGLEIGGRREKCRLVFGFPQADDTSARSVGLATGQTLEGACRGKVLGPPQPHDDIPPADWYVKFGSTSVPAP
jgi:hypothetical protein